MNILEQTIHEFEQWRNSRATREETPPYLKKQIATLANTYSKQELCQSLNINSRLIDRCIEEYQTNQFVELSTSDEIATGEIYMELKIKGINAAIKGFPKDMAAMILCLGEQA